QVVQGFLPQQVGQILQQLPAGGPVHRVKQHGLLVQQKIGVVAHPLGNGVDVFKQGQTVVVGPNPIEVIGNRSYAMHSSVLLCLVVCVHAGMKWSLPSPPSGPTQSSGSFSKRVPGAISAASSPTSGTYS